MTNLLDNIGLTIKHGDLPTYPEYAKWRAKYYGTNFLSRFWCRKVRARLFLKYDGELREHVRISEMEHRQAFLNAVIEQGDLANIPATLETANGMRVSEE